MTLSNAHIYYPGLVHPTTGVVSSQTVSWYDLRAVTSGWTDVTIGSTVTFKPRIKGLNVDSGLTWSKTEFETAKAASLTAGG